MAENLKPDITVLMPVYNAERFVNEAIKSILDQTYKNFEFLIINDGSTDNSNKIIKSYTDNRITYIENKTNIKLIASLNKGIQLAKGNYIARMDADDIALPTRLEKQFNYLEKNKKIGVCGTWIETFGDTRKVLELPTKPTDIKYRLLFDSCFAHPTVMLKKKLLTDNKLFYNEKYIHAEDYALWIQLIKKCEMANIPEVLLKYRVHKNSISNTHKLIQEKTVMQISREYLKFLFPRTDPEDLNSIHKILHGDFTDTQNFKVIDKILHIIWKTFKLNKSIYKHSFIQILDNTYRKHISKFSFCNLHAYKYFSHRILAQKKIIAYTK